MQTEGCHLKSPCIKYYPEARCVPSRRTSISSAEKSCGRSVCDFPSVLAGWLRCDAAFRETVEACECGREDGYIRDRDVLSPGTGDMAFCWCGKISTMLLRRRSVHIPYRCNNGARPYSLVHLRMLLRASVSLCLSSEFVLSE